MCCTGVSVYGPARERSSRAGFVSLETLDEIAGDGKSWIFAERSGSQHVDTVTIEGFAEIGIRSPDGETVLKGTAYGSAATAG